MRRICFALPALVFLGCLHSPQAVDEPGTDLQGFIAVYEAYEEYCPYFAHKGLDWKGMAAIYYPMAVQCETEEELIAVIVEMLAEIQDTAISLYERNSFGEVIQLVYPFTAEYDANYDMDVLIEQYLEPNGWAGWEEGYSEGFGWCDPALLPYFFLDTIPGGYHPSAFDSLDVFIAECIELDVPAVIIDIRMNPGGNLDNGYTCGRILMGRFAEKSYPGAIYRSRSGPEYDQYGDIRPVIYPSGSAQYTGTVLLLVGENCSDRSENMTANFINFPNVILLGDTTRGSVSKLTDCTISDDWYCWVPTGTILTYDQHWIEGAGIPPDVYVEATEADFAAGVDPVLDYAIELLEGYRQ